MITGFSCLCLYSLAFVCWYTVKDIPHVLPAATHDDGATSDPGRHERDGECTHSRVPYKLLHTSPAIICSKGGDAPDMRIGLGGGVKVWEMDCRNGYEAAECLGTSQEFFEEAMECCRRKYGTGVQHGDYTIIFEPSLMVIKG